jgi:hypothetical protein
MTITHEKEALSPEDFARDCEWMAAELERLAGEVRRGLWKKMNMNETHTRLGMTKTNPNGIGKRATCSIHLSHKLEPFPSKVPDDR